MSLKMLELIKEYPLAAGAVKGWFVNKLIESLNDESLPEEFKQFVKDQGVDDAKMSTVFDENPRSLFDVFDENEVYIETVIDTDYNFWWKIGDTQSPIGYARRTEADKAAIIEAFKLLNEKL
jgi:hypothetical protein